ncbi:MAG: inorganic pyrophosphatase [Gammaproteobacteria bacterium]|nr:inorganic pyrophosphatase [Gammaproteobacteria bacterium]
MSFPTPFYRWRPHPWHGLEIGPNAPEVVHAYIEITPTDFVKYELDKTTGYLRVDRPQQTSSTPPTLYGIIPRTYCGPRVGKLMGEGLRGDADPLDICVVSERPIDKAEVILNARVLGGLPMIDHNEADDKIIAVLENDPVFSKINDISKLHGVLVERLRHYFLTYKLSTGESKKKDVTIEGVYGKEHAMEVIRASMADYDDAYGGG